MCNVDDDGDDKDGGKDSGGRRERRKDDNRDGSRLRGRVSFGGEVGVAELLFERVFPRYTC